MSIRIGNRIQHQATPNGRIAYGVASAYVVNEHTGKRETDAIYVTWDETGMTTAEWRADLEKC
jgi:hypothetical protein